MKKLLVLVAAALLVLSTVACTKNEKVDYSAKSEGVMTYAEYDAVSADGTKEVVVEGYVQAVQSYWGGAKLYLQDPEGAYFVYCEGDGHDVNISEADYAKLVDSTDYKEGWTGFANGQKVKVTGIKSEWSGEVEIIEAKVELVGDLKWKAEAKEAKFADLNGCVNQLVVLKDLTVTQAALYNWDGSGSAGNNCDLYYSVSDGTTEYSFCVESYLMYEGSEVYNNVLNLKVGDKVDIEGFVYFYNVPQLHTTKVTVK